MTRKRLAFDLSPQRRALYSVEAEVSVERCDWSKSVCGHKRA